MSVWKNKLKAIIQCAAVNVVNSCNQSLRNLTIIKKMKLAKLYLGKLLNIWQFIAFVVQIVLRMLALNATSSLSM